KVAPGAEQPVTRESTRAARERSAPSRVAPARFTRERSALLRSLPERSLPEKSESVRSGVTLVLRVRHAFHSSDRRSARCSGFATVRLYGKTRHGRRQTVDGRRCGTQSSPVSRLPSSGCYNRRK